MRRPMLGLEGARYIALVAPGSFVLSLDELPGPACLLVAPEGRITHCNATFAAWAGRADPVGATLADLFPGDPVIAGLWEEARVIAAVEHHVARRGLLGEASFWSVRARRVDAGLLVSASDLSAFADAARAVHANQRAFLAMAAHELRAPLSAIKAWASAIAPKRRASRADDDATRDDGLAAITRQVDSMNELLSDLLEAAREGPGAMRAVRSAVPVGDLIARALVGSPAASRVAIGELPSDRVLVDARGVQAAVARLVDGVARRAADGPIAIDAARVGAEVHLHVTDRGPAIAPAVEADLFGRAARGGRRLGLGLHVVRLLAAVSGGRAWREPEGDAARFVLALPTAEGASRPRPQRPARVVVASPDDARTARAAAVLRLEGHHVVTRPSSRAADPALDIALLDLRAEGAITTIAALHERPDPPVILAFAPAGPRPPAMEGAERAGALAVLADPIDWAELVTLAQIAATARGL